MPTYSMRKSGVGRPLKHPWEEIEALYVHGEDIEQSGKDGKSGSLRRWPSQADLAKRYGLRPEQIYKRFALMGLDRKTAHQRREAFKVEYFRQLDDRKIKDLAGREIGFRMAALALAELGLRQVLNQLVHPQTGDSLLKLLTAAKRAQEIGLDALDLPMDRAKHEDCGDDWTLMRDVRRGLYPVPLEAEGDQSRIGGLRTRGGQNQ
ncbi:hypothetical protein [Holophaga foetida]|uniref:hypothetical protein n=1 Tax=Holophaga foetida TaxID=35839 RepID=UPI000247333E|nr:hypothetical protein [Holophaga foetida]